MWQMTATPGPQHRSGWFSHGGGALSTSEVVRFGGGGSKIQSEGLGRRCLAPRRHTNCKVGAGGTSFYFRARRPLQCICWKGFSTFGLGCLSAGGGVPQSVRSPPPLSTRLRPRKGSTPAPSSYGTCPGPGGGWKSGGPSGPPLPPETVTPKGSVVVVGAQPHAHGDCYRPGAWDAAAGPHPWGPLDPIKVCGVMIKTLEFDSFAGCGHETPGPAPKANPPTNRKRTSTKVETEGMGSESSRPTSDMPQQRVR